MGQGSGQEWSKPSSALARAYTESLKNLPASELQLKVRGVWVCHSGPVARGWPGGQCQLALGYPDLSSHHSEEQRSPSLMGLLSGPVSYLALLCQLVWEATYSSAPLGVLRLPATARVCTCVSLCVACMYVCTYICVCTQICLYIHKCMYWYRQVYCYTCVHVHICVLHAYLFCACICVHTCEYIHFCACMHLCTYMSVVLMYCMSYGMSVAGFRSFM